MAWCFLIIASQIPWTLPITENLTRSTRNQTLKGWRGLQEKDWRPDISDAADSQTTIDQTAADSGYIRY